MAINTLIIGESGTGKSRSLLNLDPKQTFIINVNGKPFPFKGWKSKYTQYSISNNKGNMLCIDDPVKIKNAIVHIDTKLPHFKVGIIDDSQYIMANEFMRRSKERGFDKFTEIGEHYWSIIWQCQLCRQDMMWFFLSHQESSDTGTTKAKTIGKLLDDKICVEGMFTIVLNTIVEDGKYYFNTQNTGFNTSKAPEGMFESTKIPNDLEIVRQSIIKYEEGE